MDGLYPGPVTIVRKAVGNVREVLFQRAPQVDVQELHPTADREERQIALDGDVRQRQLQAVAKGIDVAGSGVWLLAVQGRVDVPTARQDQAGDAVEKCPVVRVDRGSDGQVLRRHLVGVELVGAQDLGDRAGCLDGLDVVKGDPADVAGVLAPLEGRYGDSGPGAVVALGPVRGPVSVLFRGIQIAQLRQSFRFPRAAME